ncbi:uncharacterized protein LOC135204071 [Macrobrachium nipponense]|uniref:uncharacterized protein LOC135204071 n=1 Tax=Macrobrachium nipponense TaxID=159736 RepID=UPI0030C7F44D
MCRSIGICVAITLIVIGVLFLIGGILGLVAPIIIDCDSIDDLTPEDYETCQTLDHALMTAGIVTTCIGGILVLVGIIMIYCLRSRRPKIIQAAPVIATIPPGYPQYQNPLMHQNPEAPRSSAPAHPDLSNFTQHS